MLSANAGRDEKELLRHALRQLKQATCAFYGVHPLGIGWQVSDNIAPIANLVPGAVYAGAIQKASAIRTRNALTMPQPAFASAVLEPRFCVAAFSPS